MKKERDNYIYLEDEEENYYEAQDSININLINFLHENLKSIHFYLSRPEDQSRRKFVRFRTNFRYFLIDGKIKLFEEDYHSVSIKIQEKEKNSSFYKNKIDTQLILRGYMFVDDEPTRWIEYPYTISDPELLSQDSSKDERVLSEVKFMEGIALIFLRDILNKISLYFSVLWLEEQEKKNELEVYRPYPETELNFIDLSEELLEEKWNDNQPISNIQEIDMDCEINFI
jgi:hypothetical protein